MNAASALLNHIPLKSFIGINKPHYGQSHRVASLERLQAFDTTCFNTRSFTNVIVLDIDCPDAALRCVDMRDCDSRLVPNMIVANRYPEDRPGHAHAVYVLDQPFVITTSKARGIIRDVRRRLTQAIPGADPHYTNYWLKNPLNERWQTTVVREKLHDISELWQVLPSLPALVMPTQSSSQERAALSFLEGSRNADIFEATRHWAYGEWPKYGHESSFRAAVYVYASAVNERCSSPLPDQEIKMIARSISHFCFEKHPCIRRTDAGWNVGVLNLQGQGVSHKTACRLGAEHTNAIRKQKSTELVRETRESHPAASKSEIARLTKLMRKTVARHWDSAGDEKQTTEQRITETTEQRSAVPVTSLSSVISASVNPCVSSCVNPCVSSSVSDPSVTSITSHVEEVKNHYSPDSVVLTPSVTPITSHVEEVKNHYSPDSVVLTPPQTLQRETMRSLIDDHRKESMTARYTLYDPFKRLHSVATGGWTADHCQACQYSYNDAYDALKGFRDGDDLMIQLADTT